MSLRYHPLFRINGATLTVRPDFWAAPVLLIAGITGLSIYLAPARPFIVHLLIGVAGMGLALLSDVGHACAHTVSARLAGAPMDEIRLALDMPRTIYFDNDVQPRQHIIRSLGGPIYSLAGLAISLLWRSLALPGSVSHLLADISTVAFGFIGLAALVPMPIIDGGVLLKWGLVVAGVEESRADRMARRAGVAISGLVILVGVVFLISRVWLVGGILAGVGAFGIAAALGFVK